jgi:site-specific recombinase XerD
MRHKHSGAAPGLTGQAEQADTAQAAFDFGDSHQGVPELVSEGSPWETDPRAAVRTWLAMTKKSSGKDFNERSVTQYVAMVGAACDFWSDAGQGTSILSAAVADVEGFLSKKNRRGKASSDSTRRRYLGLLQSVFDHLVEAGLRDSNPARELLQVPANSMVERAEPVFLTPEQMTQLRDWICSGPSDDWQAARNRALIGTFAATGITTSEAQALSFTGHEEVDGKISLYIRHRRDDKCRFVTAAAWCTGPMRKWTELRKSKEVAEKLLLGETGGPLFPANPKRADEHAQPQPAHSLSDTEIYVIVAEALSSISPHGAQLGPQTLRNTYIATQLLAGAKDAKLMTDLGLETTFTIDVLRKQLVDRGLLDSKSRRSRA